MGVAQYAIALNQSRGKGIVRKYIDSGLYIFTLENSQGTFLCKEHNLLIAMHIYNRRG